MHVALRYTMCTFLFVLKIRCVPTPFLSISRFAIVCSISSFLHILLIIVTLCIAAASTKFIINYGNRNSQETLPASLYTFKDVDRFYFKVKKKDKICSCKSIEYGQSRQKLSNAQDGTRTQYPIVFEYRTMCHSLLSIN